jgi:hypothetical protein
VRGEERIEVWAAVLRRRLHRALKLIVGPAYRFQHD